MLLGVLSRATQIIVISSSIASTAAIAVSRNISIYDV
jgi:hypothetical protein